jgi:hypothetical protein
MANASSLRLISMLGWVLIAGTASEQSSLTASQDAAQLIYVKKSTRRETAQATLEASRLPRPVGNWYRMGPFDNTENKGFKTVHPIERVTNVDPAKTYPDAAGKARRWRIAPQLEDGKVNSLAFYAESEFKFTYLYRTIYSDTDGMLDVSLGSDDTLTVILNGRQLLARNAERGAAPDQEHVTLPLQAGKNHLLLKVCNYRGPTAFYFRPVYPPAIETELNDRLEADFPSGAEARHYRIVTLPIPKDIVLEVGGLAFRPDGKLLACTRRGDIYLISGAGGDGPALADAASRDTTTDSAVTYRLFATGLHEPLGLLVDGEDVYVVQRPELTRLRDTDGDDMADEFTTVCDRWGVSGDYHEFAFGPARDKDGNFFITLNVGFGGGHQSKAPWRGWCVKITPKGELIPWASGLRSPNGINFSPEGDLFYVDNQGEWVAACKMDHVQPGRFYGHPAGLRWHEKWKDLKMPSSGQRYDALDPAIPLKPPAIWFPYGKMSQSASQPRWDATGGNFGPFAGQCFVGDQTKSNIMRVALEKVHGVYQGACFPFRSGFECGVNRLVFGPAGKLYVGMTNRGWGSVGGAPFGLQRLDYTGVVPFEIHTMSLTAGGFDLTFTKPIDPASADQLETYSLQSYTYNYWSTYGSPEIDRQVVPVGDVSVSSDRRKVSLHVEGLHTGRVYELHVDGVTSADGNALLHPEAYYTLNVLR